MQKSALSLLNLEALMRNSKQAEGKSAQTLSWYEGGIRRYTEWLERQGMSPTLDHLTLDTVRHYIVDLQTQPVNTYHPFAATKSQPLSDSTVNGYARVLRSFSNWLHEEGYTAKSVLTGLKVPRVAKKKPDILTTDEIARVVGVLNPRTEIGSRDQAIFILMLDTGMRAGELCGLRMRDLHLDEGYAMVLGKGRKQRPVKIGARAAKATRFYISHWRKPAMPHIEQVFLTCPGINNETDFLCHLPGEPLTVDALGHLFRRLRRIADVPRLHPHLLRHTFACMHLKRYRDPFALKSLLGHTTLAMTNHYCEAVKEMDFVRADSVSIVDGLDMSALDVNRRGRLKPAKKGKSL